MAEAKKPAAKKAAPTKVAPKKPAPKKADAKAPAGTPAAKKALPKPGDKVAWNTSQGETHGTVEKIVTKTTKVKGYEAKATAENPEVMVKSAKSGKKAVHKPEELKKA